MVEVAAARVVHAVAGVARLACEMMLTVLAQLAVVLTMVLAVLAESVEMCLLTPSA